MDLVLILASMAASKALIVLTTVPDQKTARKIAHDLVSKRLAACVNRIGPIRSTYRWKGKLLEDPEFLLVIKTTAARYAALERRIRAIHPYVIPEIVALPVARGYAAYLEWLSG